VAIVTRTTIPQDFIIFTLTEERILILQTAYAIMSADKKGKNVA
jgi:hypothetical protein